MPLKYTMIAKTARMSVTRDRLIGGSLVLSTPVGVMARVDLGAGLVTGDLITFAGFPHITLAETNGEIVSGSLFTSDGDLFGYGLTVGTLVGDILLDKLNALKGD